MQAMVLVCVNTGEGAGGDLHRKQKEMNIRTIEVVSLDFIHFTINVKRQTQWLLTKSMILLQWFPIF